jgi:hypothetical protein
LSNPYYFYHQQQQVLQKEVIMDRQMDSTQRFPVPGEVLQDLSDKRSVRTTFRLSKQGAEALDWLAKHHRLTSKEVLEDLGTRLLFEKYSLKAGRARKGSLHELIAHAAEKSAQDRPAQSSRKTRVIPKGCLALLNQISKEYQLPRDLILDRLLLALRREVEEKAERKQGQYEKAEKVISSLDAEMTKTKQELEQILDYGDPVLEWFERLYQGTCGLLDAVRTSLTNKSPIDPDDYKQWL